MNQALERAYTQAHYVVINQRQRLVMSIAKHHLWLDELLLQKGVKTAAFITAYNPQSQIVAQKLNRQRQQLLNQKIISAGYQSLPGYSTDEQGLWPVEKSSLVFGISTEDARGLALFFNQAAYLCCRVGLPVELKMIN